MSLWCQVLDMWWSTELTNRKIFKVCSLRVVLIWEIITWVIVQIQTVKTMKNFQNHTSLCSNKARDRYSTSLNNNKESAKLGGHLLIKIMCSQSEWLSLFLILGPHPTTTTITKTLLLLHALLCVLGLASLHRRECLLDTTTQAITIRVTINSCSKLI